jgi:predicted component of type VI protein secretion system
MKMNYGEASKFAEEELRKCDKLKEWDIKHGANVIVGSPYNDYEIYFGEMEGATLNEVIEHIKKFAADNNLDLSKVRLTYIDSDTMNVDVAAEFEKDVLIQKAAAFIERQIKEQEQSVIREQQFQNERKTRRLRELQQQLDPEKQRILTIERDQLMKEVGHLLPQK